MSDTWPTVSHQMTLDPAELSAHTARDVLRTVCTEARIVSETIETALLLVSELVTNAVVHGGGRPALDIDVRPDLMHVSVSDNAPGTPHVAHEPVTSEHGRGLFLVETLASRWGVQPSDGNNKTVWFELDRVPRTPPGLRPV
ncbi:hypothetical protein GCM10009795_028600 [Nocardioides hankookensis]